MTIDVDKAIEALDLRLATDDPALRAVRERRREGAIALTREKLDAPTGAADSALLHLIAIADADAPEELDPRVASLFVQWLQRDGVRGNVRRRLYLGPVLAEASPATLERLLRDVARGETDATPTVVGLSGILSSDARRRILEELARHRNDEIREHLFTLLGQHRPLSPPGSIGLAFNAERAFEYVLSIGLNDPNARVRERALAAAYGLGLVQGVRENVLRLLEDPDNTVRQYAIIALGVLDDDASRNVIARFLREGSQQETTSAIWAAARRPDIVAELVSMAGDSREWVNDELLGAFAEVSAPLTDAQIAELERRTHSHEFARLRERHLDRTRRGQPELGQHRVDVVLKR